MSRKWSVLFYEIKRKNVPCRDVALTNPVSMSNVTFEDLGYQNGFKYWWASEFMSMLDYPSMTSFQKPLNKAMSACLTVGIDIHENFVKVEREIEGEIVGDYKLTRFACYMVAMNCDIKKPVVSRAQAYFAKQAEKIDLILEGTNDLERLLSREEVKEGKKLLNATAKKAGVENFGLFTHAGYRGLYNKGIQAVAWIIDKWSTLIIIKPDKPKVNPPANEAKLD
mgnify:CR=1 FL=1